MSQPPNGGSIGTMLLRLNGIGATCSSSIFFNTETTTARENLHFNSQCPDYRGRPHIPRGNENRNQQFSSRRYLTFTHRWRSEPQCWALVPRWQHFGVKPHQHYNNVAMELSFTIEKRCLLQALNLKYASTTGSGTAQDNFVRLG